MVKVTVDNQEFYLDGYLKSNLDIVKEQMAKDWDCVICIDGAEGSGKSILGMTIGKYLYPELKLEDIVFTANEFMKSIVKAKKYQCIIYDEGYSGLDSSGTFNVVNRTLIKMIAEIRQKNLYVIVIMPTFFDLMKYVALWRSRVLIHVYTSKKWERGFFMFYSYERKHDLFMYGKKFYSYARPKPNFWGRFTNFYPVNEKEYRLKKLQALKGRRIADENAIREKEIQKILMERVFALPESVPNVLRCKILGISDAHYYTQRKLWEQRIKDIRELSDFEEKDNKPN